MSNGNTVGSSFVNNNLIVFLFRIKNEVLNIIGAFENIFYTYDYRAIDPFCSCRCTVVVVVHVLHYLR